MDRERFNLFQERLKTDGDFAERWFRCRSRADQAVLLAAVGLEATPEASALAAKPLSEEEMGKVVGGSDFDTCEVTGVVCKYLVIGYGWDGFDCSTCPFIPVNKIPYD